MPIQRQTKPRIAPLRAVGLAILFAALLATHARSQQAAAPVDSLLVGWAQTDITPPRESALGGMRSMRIASEVMDPLTATALALEAPYQEDGSEPVILVSCDLRSIRNDLRDAVRERLKETLPEVDPMRIILNATHTHNAPPLSTYGMDVDAMDEPEYTEFAVPRIAAVVKQAWENRAPGGVSFGLSHAVIGHNRIMAYDSGRSIMGGSTDRPDFSHVEGYEDSAVHLLYTWNHERDLTGVVVNVAVTSQVSQSLSVISADYWHDAREELRRRLGEDLYVLPQCSAAGDQMSRVHVHRRAEERMERLTGRNRRQQIAVRLADAVESILDPMRDNIEWAPPLRHHGEVVPLSRRMIPKEDLDEALADAARAQATYDRAMERLAEDPELEDDPDWQRQVTRASWEARRGANVERRFELQRAAPHYLVELHAIRLGDMAIATNPFELYLDLGVQIQTRSRAVQTFVVQLASGSGGYVPTARSVAGGAYGAVPASTNVGPEGGKEIVNWTVDTIRNIWFGPQVNLAPAEWRLAFEDDFDREHLGERWEVAGGEWRLEDGSLFSLEGGGLLMTAEPRAGLHRIEMTATALETDDGRVSDLSVLVHAGEDGTASGYFLQFGGFWNSRSNLRKAGDTLRTDTERRIVPGKAHEIVGEFDGKHVRLTVDGEPVFAYREKHPMLGSGHRRLGIYTYTPARIDRVRVYTSEAVRE